MRLLTRCHGGQARVGKLRCVFDLRRTMDRAWAVSRGVKDVYLGGQVDAEKAVTIVWGVQPLLLPVSTTGCWGRPTTESG